MLHESPRGPSATQDSRNLPWFKGLSPSIWFVFVVAALGWLFDTMDQQLFALARKPAITQLLRGTEEDLTLQRDIEQTLPTASEPERKKVYNERFGRKVDEYSGYATSIFMIGWAIGGIFFGILGDKVGRARTMLLTVLCYSLFTGLSALSRGVWDFAFYRFLTGLGVGGQFAVGVAMVAEVMPDRSRPSALGWLQALSAVGNMMAATTGIVLGQLEERGIVSGAWKIMFLVGLAPAVNPSAGKVPLVEGMDRPNRSNLGRYRSCLETHAGARMRLLG